ncbi:MAG: hypothetical protein IPN95_05050 [Bacteroidetes bacterium]|nr:hypothetical protein [Bacteroidota bacterium]
MTCFCAGYVKCQVIPPDTVIGIVDSLKADTFLSTKTKIKSLREPERDTVNAPIIIMDAGEATAVGDSSRKDTSKSKISRFLSTIHLSPPRERYDAKVAVRRSLLLPGWGQLYNRRPWKVPIIYAGFGVFAFFIIDNHRGYLDYDKAVKCVGFPGTCNPNPYYVLGQTYGVQGLINIREGFRRYRDLNFIIAGLWYTLQAVDAYVDAHMRGFNVSEDLSLDFHPNVGIDPFRQNSLYTGMTVSLKLRK